MGILKISAYFFGRENQINPREKFSIFGRENELRPWKNRKNPSKWAWKSLFPRENFGKSHAWKPLFKHVKNITHYTREKENTPVKKNNKISVKIPI